MEYLETVVVLVVIVFIIISLYKEVFKPITTFLIAIGVFGVFKILSPKEMLEGFANEQIAVIILLLIIGSIIQKTSVVDLLFGYIFNRAKNYKGFLARMMLYVSSSSAFLNNTPLVAMMMPFVHGWCRKKNVAPSKLLIPLSYAAILGGSATLIGTSTNLLVNGMAIESGYDLINIFDFSYVGLPMIIIGFLYMLFWGHRLLPEKKDVLTSFSDYSREYLVEAKIENDSYLIGKTVKQANLRNLKGLFLVEIVRGMNRFSPVSPNRMLQAKDRLIFAGETDNIVDLIKSAKGLSLNYSNDLVLQERANVVEVIVSPNSLLVNKKVRKVNFRAKYDAAIIAVHRNGEKLSGKIGDIVLNAGDVLLLVTGKGFYMRSESENDFYYISTVNEIHNITRKNRIILLGGLVLAIMLSALKLISLFKALIVLLVLIIVSKIASLTEIRKAIDFNLIAIAGLALGLGKAMINTGTAEMIAGHVVSVMAPLGVIGILMGLYLITNLLASYMTNIAAVSIIFPISLSIGEHLLSTNQTDSLIPFILIVAYGAAANFISPIGYMTNIMVYGSGNYSFTDFFKVGLPLTLLHLIVTVAILIFVF